MNHTVNTGNPRTYSVDVPKGGEVVPMTLEELRGKFHECAGR